MTLIPHRTVSSQIAAHLRREIAAGTWSAWLPNERELSASLQASRNSLRTALRQLRAEAVIRSVPGSGHRIAAKPAPVGPADGRKTIGLLLPDPIGSVRPLLSLWIDELRELLPGHGYQLRVHVGRQYYRPAAARALERLLGQHPHDAWVLALTSEPLQRWFSARGVPCLVAGGTYPGVALRSLDSDHRAICRHAAGTLVRLGHRRIALVNREARLPGDAASEAGFMEGVRLAGRLGVQGHIGSHRDDLATVDRALDRLLRRADAPTGFVVCESYVYLSVASLLASRGLRIPRDVSLISRDDDPFLRFLAPPPARYVVTPHAFAKKLLHAILDALRPSPVGPAATWLQPKFQPGASLAPPPA